MFKDMDQSAKMLKLRIKIDVWSKGIDESIREEIRNHLRDLFCQLPARRYIIRANDLCRLMFFATLNHVGMTKYPGFNVSAEITLDEAGAGRLWQIKRLAFGQLGKNYYFIS